MDIAHCATPRPAKGLPIQRAHVPPPPETDPDKTPPPTVPTDRPDEVKLPPDEKPEKIIDPPAN